MNSSVDLSAIRWVEHSDYTFEVISTNGIENGDNVKITGNVRTGTFTVYGTAVEVISDTKITVHVDKTETKTSGIITPPIGGLN